jgi:hypothetical protein
MRIQLNSIKIDHHSVKRLFEPPYPWYAARTFPKEGYRQIFRGEVTWMGVPYHYHGFLAHEGELVLVKVSQADPRILYVYSGDGKLIGIPKPVQFNHPILAEARQELLEGDKNV